MSCTAVARCLLICGALLGLADASFIVRPFSHYASGPPAEGSGPGVQRFRHEEHHEFEDGTEVELRWEADANPSTILALDLEHQQGVRVLSCEPDELVLQVTATHLPRVEEWRHVTASDHVHGCGHLKEKNLYHRVLEVRNIRELSTPAGSHAVTLGTEELRNPAHVFSHCTFSFNLLPAEVKHHGVERPLPRRRLGGLTKASFHKGVPAFSNSFTPTESNQATTIFDMDVPREMKNLAWNWDYEMNTTKNPQFKYTFPGGFGGIRWYAPYLKAHFSLRMNYTSHFKSVRKPPHVTIDAELNGTMDFNADIATSVRFTEDKSASVIGNVLDHLNIPVLGNLSDSDMLMTPLKFDVGGTPFTIKPDFSCALKAYHKGKMAGSMRFSLATEMLLNARLTFDTNTGVQTNFSAKAKNVKFMPPHWLLYTRSFELGVMLEPELCMTGGMEEENDMSMCFTLRPYYNMSIMQEDADASGVETYHSSPTHTLAIYPFRAVGLPRGKNYAIRITANNGTSRSTSIQMSTGVVEFCDNPAKFDFQEISQADFLDAKIEVAILEDGKDPPVATGVASCKSIVGGICHPTPVMAEMEVDGQLVTVDLEVVWQDDAVSAVKSHTRSVSLRFPTVELSEAVSSRLSSSGDTPKAHLRFLRSGRVYSVRLLPQYNSPTKMLLEGEQVYELGPCLLSSWNFASETLTPKLELIIDDAVVGVGSMPPIRNWDKAAAGPGHLGTAEGKQALNATALMVQLYAANKETVGVIEVELDVQPASRSAFWVSPASVESSPAGQTRSFEWAVHGGKENLKYDFTLAAAEVSDMGELTHTGWKQSIKAQCRVDEGVEVNRYTAGAQPCIFGFDIQIPQSLQGHNIVMVVGWEDANGHLHEMISSTVQFVGTSRRLGRATPNSNKWSLTKGKNNDRQRGEYGEKLSNGLKKLRTKACTAKPLRYRVGAGVYFVERMKNVLMPLDMDDSGAMWSSEPFPLLRLPTLPTFGSSNGSNKLSDHLPPVLCAGGICRGMMPACPPTQVNGYKIKHIVLKFDRTFKWKEHIGPKLRYAIAYGLALFPSAVKVGGRQMQAELQRATSSLPAATTTAAPSDAPLDQPRSLDSGKRRLESGRFEEMEDDEDDVDDTVEFDQFHVSIEEPIPFVLDEILMNFLINSGSFRIEDGREATHGPIHITGYELHHEGSGVQGFERKFDSDEELLRQPSAKQMSRGEQPKRPVWASATIVACILGTVAFSVVGVALSALRCRSYMPLLSVELAAAHHHHHQLPRSLRHLLRTST